MSLITLSVMPLIVYVLPLLVCPYAKIVAARSSECKYPKNDEYNTVICPINKQAVKFGALKKSPLIPETTDKATSLAPSS